MASGLPQDCLPPLLELLDADGLAMLRSALNLRDLDGEAHAALLRAVVLELLLATKFPFTHAAYVMGLNGTYYSLDTIAEKHYGIPRALPTLLCALFRHMVPNVPFTTIRIQKFAAATNFGGRHKTLAFSLYSDPKHEETDEEETHDTLEQIHDDEAPTESLSILDVGYVLCLSAGCTGGYSERRAKNGPWCWLAGNETPRRWASFPLDSELRWHWPRDGDMYAITVMCEAPEFCGKLGRRERREMTKVGFTLPVNVEPEATSNDELEEPVTLTEPQMSNSPSRRPSSARVTAAKRLMHLDNVGAPSFSQVEEAFRNAARQVHPDRMASDSPIPASWLMSQLTWARRVLRDAASFEDASEFVGANDLEDENGTDDVLMLAAP